MGLHEAAQDKAKYDPVHDDDKGILKVILVVTSS